MRMTPTDLLGWSCSELHSLIALILIPAATYIIFRIVWKRT